VGAVRGPARDLLALIVVSIQAHQIVTLWSVLTVADILLVVVDLDRDWQRRR
jgi:hypothetical protein